MPELPSGRRRWLTLVVLSLGVSLIVIDGTIVNVSLPVIIGELDWGLTSAQWITTLYMLIFAAGRLGVRPGRGPPIWLVDSQGSPDYCRGRLATERAGLRAAGHHRGRSGAVGAVRGLGKSPRPSCHRQAEPGAGTGRRDPAERPVVASRSSSGMMSRLPVLQLSMEAESELLPDVCAPDRP